VTETSKTVGTALDLLRSLAVDGPATVAELARRTNTNRTAAHRLVATLVAHRLVRRAGSVYEPATGLLELAGSVATDVRDAARPELETLARVCLETAVLSVPEEHDAVAVDQVVSTERPVQVRYRPGHRHGLDRGAHGRALLAYARPDVRDAVVATADDPGRLSRQLDDVCDRGFAISHNELQFDASGIAAPVLDSAGLAVASIGVVAPVNRFTNEDTLVADVCRAARDTEARLGGMPAGPGRRPPETSGDAPSPA
jgi:IclR family transcriptional regulator, KDG regulon repressor